MVLAALIFVYLGMKNDKLKIAIDSLFAKKSNIRFFLLHPSSDKVDKQRLQDIRTSPTHETPSHP